MSRPRYWWDGTVKKLLRRYPDKLKEEGSLQSAIALKAIEDTFAETLLLPDGKERVELIKKIYCDNTYTYTGASLSMNISMATANRWVQRFAYLVGKKMGYTKNN